MCGKFTQRCSWTDMQAFSEPPPVVKGDLDEPVVVATPMRFAHVIRLNAAGAQELVPMRWGFAGKDDPNPTPPRHMHARAETIDELPTFRNAFAHRRGILMVHTFNEGEELPSGKTKQWVITPNDGQPIAIAVIYEEWRSGADTLLTFVQVTAQANTLISRITDRMPAILPRAAWRLWLGEAEAPLAKVKALLQTYEDGGNWTMTEQASSKKLRQPKPPNPREPGHQLDFF